MFEITDFTKNGECIRCGSCCSDFLPLSNREIKQIKQYIKKHHIKRQVHTFAPFNVTSDMLDATCPFYSPAEKKCVIYEIRPDICREFKCNKPKPEIESTKRFFGETRHVYSMSGVFFNDHENERMIMGG